MKLGQKIKELRAKKNISQSELGDLVGVHYTHIGKYENNQQMPSTDTLKKIADVFEVSIDYLLNDTDSNFIEIKINDEELLAQLKAIKDLPDNDKKVVKELINAFLIKNKIQTLVK